MRLAVPVAQTPRGELRPPGEVTPADGPFSCLDCAGAVVLKRGEVKRAHFAHKSETLCVTLSTGESTQHRAAKRILATNLHRWTFVSTCPRCRATSQVRMPPGCSAHEEMSFASYRLDVGVVNCEDNVTHAIEVRHTTQEKGRALHTAGLTVIEVSATDVLRAYESGSFSAGFTASCITCTHDYENEIETALALNDLTRLRAALATAPWTIDTAEVAHAIAAARAMWTAAARIAALRGRSLHAVINRRIRQRVQGPTQAEPNVKCKCQAIAATKISHTQANPGRQFYTCMRKRCNFFLWVGRPAMTQGVVNSTLTRPQAVMFTSAAAAAAAYHEVEKQLCVVCTQNAALDCRRFHRIEGYFTPKRPRDTNMVAMCDKCIDVVQNANPPGNFPNIRFADGALFMSDTFHRVNDS